MVSAWGAPLPSSDYGGSARSCQLAGGGEWAAKRCSSAKTLQHSAALLSFDHVQSSGRGAGDAKSHGGGWGTVLEVLWAPQPGTLKKIVSGVVAPPTPLKL